MQIVGVIGQLRYLTAGAHGNPRQAVSGGPESRVGGSQHMQDKFAVFRGRYRVVSHHHRGSLAYSRLPPAGPPQNARATSPANAGQPDIPISHTPGPQRLSIASTRFPRPRTYVPPAPLATRSLLARPERPAPGFAHPATVGALAALPCRMRLPAAPPPGITPAPPPAGDRPAHNPPPQQARPSSG